MLKAAFVVPLFRKFKRDVCNKFYVKDTVYKMYASIVNPAFKTSQKPSFLKNPYMVLQRAGLLGEGTDANRRTVHT